MSYGANNIFIAHNEMKTNAHISHFGALKTSSVVPVIKANFPGSALDTNLWTETTANSGSTTVTRGVANINTGTNAANQGTQQTEINLVKVELQGCNSKLSDIKSAVEGTLNVSIV